MPTAGIILTLLDLNSTNVYHYSEGQYACSMGTGHNMRILVVDDDPEIVLTSTSIRETPYDEV